MPIGPFRDAVRLLKCGVECVNLSDDSRVNAFVAWKRSINDGALSDYRNMKSRLFSVYVNTHPRKVAPLGTWYTGDLDNLKIVLLKRR